MANLNEEAQWVNGIYQLERTDPVEAGTDGISNRQAQQLANRTQHLKVWLEDHDAEFETMFQNLDKTWIADTYVGDTEHPFGLAIYNRNDARSPRVGEHWFSKRFKSKTKSDSYTEIALSFSGSKPQLAIKHKYESEETAWNIITDYADANVATQQALVEHDSDANAHAALTAAVNAKAAQAQLAAEAAMQNGGMYETAVEGIAATTNNDYFRVIGTGETALQLYKNNSGTAQLMNSLAAKQAIDNVLNFFNAQLPLMVPKSDFVIKASVNLAKKNLIESGKYINNAGTVTNAIGWKMIKIPIAASGAYTFGGFQITTGGYWAVWNDANVKLQNGSFSSGLLPLTITAATGAKWLLITIARPDDIDDKHKNLVVCQGSSLIDYVDPKDTITGIGDYLLAGSGSNTGGTVQLPENIAEQGSDATFAKLTVDSIEASAIIINLPTGAGSPPMGVESNQAWIDTSAGNVIKVKP